MVRTDTDFEYLQFWANLYRGLGSRVRGDTEGSGSIARPECKFNTSLATDDLSRRELAPIGGDQIHLLDASVWSKHDDHCLSFNPNVFERVS